MFEKLRKEYKKFTYEKYDINETFSDIIITYYFNKKEDDHNGSI